MALDEAEIGTLVTLARHLMRADGRVSDQELRGMLEIARQVGLRVFSDALERQADTATLDLDGLVDLAARVSNTESRVAMFMYLAELANTDGIAAPERQLLDALAATWDLDWTAE